MLKIVHRVNDPVRLRETPRELGVEMDLHAFGSRLVAQHDASRDGPDFDAWLDAYDHAFAIFNVKEEGIETAVRDRVLAHGIVNFFFLDLSFPALVRMAKSGERRLAVRVSEYEPVEQALRLSSMVDWVWLDVFSGFPVGKADVDALKKSGLKLCLVSPELHGRETGEIAEMQARIERDGLAIDAVCTKQPRLWQLAGE